MRKIIILGSVLTTLAIGSAAGGEASWMFAPSERNDLPASRARNTAPAEQMEVSPYPESARRSFGYSSNITGSTDALSTGTGRVGFSAAQGFGPSDENDLPMPRFQKVH